MEHYDATKRWKSDELIEQFNAKAKGNWRVKFILLMGQRDKYGETWKVDVRIQSLSGGASRSTAAQASTSEMALRIAVCAAKFSWSSIKDIEFAIEKARRAVLNAA